MAKNNYLELLKNPKWQKIRLDVLNRDEFMCMSCGNKEEQLQVHHKKYVYGLNPWEYNKNDLVTFCKSCHEDATELKKNVKMLIDNNFVIPEYLYFAETILKHISQTTPDKIEDIIDYIKKVKNG